MEKRSNKNIIKSKVSPLSYIVITITLCFMNFSGYSQITIDMTESQFKILIPEDFDSCSCNSLIKYIFFNELSSLNSCLHQGANINEHTTILKKGKRKGIIGYKYYYESYWITPFQFSVFCERFKSLKIMFDSTVYVTDDMKMLKGKNTQQVQHSGNYKNGKEEGEWVFYFPGGAKAERIVSYKEGRLHGKMLMFNWRPHYVTTQIDYQDGLKHGKMYLFDKKGNVKVEKTFEEGLEVNPNGKPKGFNP